MYLRRLPAKCPHCGRTIYSRRGRLACEWCNSVLPEEYRYTEAEQAQIDATMAQIEIERRDQQAREEEAQRNAAQGAMMGPFFISGS